MEKQIQIQKVNNFNIVDFSSKKQNKKFYGSDKIVFTNDMLKGFPIFYLCSSKFSGKTFQIGQIILKFINPNFKEITHIHWVSNYNTQQNDQTYLDIKKYLEKNKYQFFEHSDDSREYLYNNIIPQIEKHNQEVNKKIQHKRQQQTLADQLIQFTLSRTQPVQQDENNENFEKQLQQYKKQNIKQFNNILIYDDIQFQQMRKNKLNSLCKQIRHYKTLLILSSQYIKDVDPQIFSNLSYILFWKNINKSVLKQIYYMLNLPNDLDFDNFLQLYNYITNKEKYNFLMINRDTQQMFQNFTHQIFIKDEFSDIEEKSEDEQI